MIRRGGEKCQRRAVETRTGHSAPAWATEWVADMFHHEEGACGREGAHLFADLLSV